MFAKGSREIVQTYFHFAQSLVLEFCSYPLPALGEEVRDVGDILLAGGRVDDGL